MWELLIEPCVPRSVPRPHPPCEPPPCRGPDEWGGSRLTGRAARPVSADAHFLFRQIVFRRKNGTKKPRSRGSAARQTYPGPVVTDHHFPSLAVHCVKAPVAAEPPSTLFGKPEGRHSDPAGRRKGRLLIRCEAEAPSLPQTWAAAAAAHACTHPLTALLQTSISACNM